MYWSLRWRWRNFNSSALIQCAAAFLKKKSYRRHTRVIAFSLIPLWCEHRRRSSMFFALGSCRLIITIQHLGRVAGLEKFNGAFKQKIRKSCSYFDCWRQTINIFQMIEIIEGECQKKKMSPRNNWKELEIGKQLLLYLRQAQRRITQHAQRIKLQKNEIIRNDWAHFFS